MYIRIYYIKSPDVRCQCYKKAMLHVSVVINSCRLSITIISPSSMSLSHLSPMSLVEFMENPGVFCHKVPMLPVRFKKIPYRYIKFKNSHVALLILEVHTHYLTSHKS